MVAIEILTIHEFWKLNESEMKFKFWKIQRNDIKNWIQNLTVDTIGWFGNIF